MNAHTLYIGDCLEVLRTLPAESVHCVVTSPPYWGLRDYGVSGQIGLERTPEEYVSAMVEVFREVRRVLRKDGTCWLNLGDSYAGNRGYQVPDSKHRDVGNSRGMTVSRRRDDAPIPRSDLTVEGLKPKDLVGIPWRVAFALQADGWWLRSDIVWAKPNPMPESVVDRPTRSHEYLFLLTRSERYWYDADAIREPAVTTNKHDATGLGYAAPGQTEQSGNHQKVPVGWDTSEGASGTIHREGRSKPDKQRGHSRRHAGFNDRWDGMTHAEQAAMGRNKRDVWEIAPRPFPEAHFATFPEALAEPCILAGCPEHVCPVCGAPWTRATHKERIGPTWNQRGDKQRTAEEVGHNLQTGHERYRKRYEVQVVTDGFRPTCDCPGNDGQVGGVVLDPFAGAGTVTLVAKRLGRSSIYVDLNPDYARIAERRCFEQREIQEDYTYEVIDARKEVTADA